MEKFVRTKTVSLNQTAREFFDDLVIKTRHVGTKQADTGFEVFGKSFRTPIMSAALSHLRAPQGADGMEAMAKGMKQIGALTFVGMMDNDWFERTAAQADGIIRIIKPYADESVIEEEIRVAERCGALAVGMDIEHGFDDAGNSHFEPKSKEDLARYCKMTKLPFVVKGVLSAEDVKACLEAGVGGIYVSNHHGNLESIVPSAMVLPEIAEAAGGAVPIFMDGNVNNGADAFKALALGADAVCIGQPLMHAVAEGGAEGAASMIQEMTEELGRTMSFTNCPTLKKIDCSVLLSRSNMRI